MTLRVPTVLPPGLAGGLLPDAVASAGPIAARTPTRLPDPAPALLTTALRAPTRLAGVQRQGLQVGLAQLQMRFAGQPAARLQQVQGWLQGSLPQALTRRQASEWGVAVQRRYGELLEQALALTRHPQRLAAQAHLERLHALLHEVSQALQQRVQPGLLGRWCASPSGVLQRHRREIDQLREALASASHSLIGQLEALDALERELSGVAADLEAASLAATFLAETLATQPGTLPEDGRVQALHHRAGELARTHVHLADARYLRKQADASLQHLVGCIQHAVLLLLPAWLEQEAHTARVPPTPTLLRQRLQALEALVQALRPD